MKVGKGDALIVVDMQRDFMPGGALPVSGGDEIIGVVNSYIRKFEESGALIVLTRDWHPENHISFRERGGPWPSHCVQGTSGAEFHPGLYVPKGALIVSKGSDSEREAYSGFEGTDLEEELRRRGVRRVFVAGVATDFCVKSTVLDALKRGFEVYVLLDACRSVSEEGGERAVEEMIESGAKITSYSEIFDLEA